MTLFRLDTEVKNCDITEWTDSFVLCTAKIENVALRGEFSKNYIWVERKWLFE